MTDDDLGETRVYTQEIGLRPTLVVRRLGDRSVGCPTFRPRQGSKRMAGRSDATVWMWAQACDLIEQAERLHGQFSRPSASTQAQVVWEPPIDVFEDDREVVVVVAMPG